MGKNKNIILIIISVWAAFSNNIVSGLANQNGGVVTIKDSIAGYRVYEDDEWSGFCNKKLHEMIYKAINDSNGRVAILAMMPKTEAMRNPNDSNSFYRRRLDLGLKVITVTDSTTMRFVEATKHYYMFKDTIIPVVFEYDINPINTIFTDIRIEE